MKSAILFDTCAALWATQADALSREAEAAIAEAEAAGFAIMISPITAWEVGQLVSRGRVALREEPKRWLQGLLDAGVALAEMTPEILIDSSFLPHADLRDPADRIIVATARALNLRLMTRDRTILAYAEAGHVQAIPC